MSKIRVGVIGAAGYTAGELLRILINHPDVEIHDITDGIFSKASQLTALAVGPCIIAAAALACI